MHLNLNHFFNYTNSNKFACEAIRNGTPCWMYFDAEKYYKVNPTVEITTRFFQLCLQHIRCMFPEKGIFDMTRNVRKVMKGTTFVWKASFHFVVKVKVMPETILEIQICTRKTKTINVIITSIYLFHI